MGNRSSSYSIVENEINPITPPIPKPIKVDLKVKATCNVTPSNVVFKYKADLTGSRSLVLIALNLDDKGIPRVLIFNQWFMLVLANIQTFTVDNVDDELRMWVQKAPLTIRIRDRQFNEYVAEKLRSIVSKALVPVPFELKHYQSCFDQ